jgi:hypothetical protein
MPLCMCVFFQLSQHKQQTIANYPTNIPHFATKSTSGSPWVVESGGGITSMTIDHPRYSVKALESNDSSGKAKVRCMLYFEARIVQDNALDESMVIARGHGVITCVTHAVVQLSSNTFRSIYGLQVFFGGHICQLWRSRAGHNTGHCFG